jgi:hypothetical protein
MLGGMTTRALEQELSDFFASDVALRASQGIRDGAVVEIAVDGTSYFFTKKKGLGKVLKKKPSEAEVTFWVPPSTLKQVLALAGLPGTSMATLGVFIFDAILTHDESRKIKFKVRANVLTLWLKGYFSVLKAGGPEVASYLAKIGLSSIGQIKDMVQKIRG